MALSFNVIFRSNNNWIYTAVRKAEIICNLDRINSDAEHFLWSRYLTYFGAHTTLLLGKRCVTSPNKVDSTRAKDEAWLFLHSPYNSQWPLHTADRLRITIGNTLIIKKTHKKINFNKLMKVNRVKYYIHSSEIMKISRIITCQVNNNVIDLFKQMKSEQKSWLASVNNGKLMKIFHLFGWEIIALLWLQWKRSPYIFTRMLI